MFPEATNPESEATAAPAEEQEVAQQQEQSQETEIEQGDGEESEQQTTQADDTDEIELNGQKYRVPKAVKPAVMMHADYTRKTQELAEQRKSWEAEHQQRAEFAEAHQKDLSKLYGIDSQLAEYQQIDWGKLWQDDPVRAGQLTSQHQQLQANRQTLIGQLQENERKRQSEAQTTLSKRATESAAYLQREIPGWSPELDQKLSGFAIEQGFTKEDLQGLAIAKPQAVKILHLAYLGQQLIAKTKASAPKPPEAKPVPELGANRTPAVKDPSRMSTAEWMKWRDKQVANRRR